MTSKRTLASKRIEMNGAWYLSAEQAASLLDVGESSMAEREDFQAPGRFILYDGMRFYSESYGQQLAAQPHLS